MGSGWTTGATQLAAPPDRHGHAPHPTAGRLGTVGGLALRAPVQFGPGLGSSVPSLVCGASGRAGREALHKHTVFFFEAYERLSMS